MITISKRNKIIISVLVVLCLCVAVAMPPRTYRFTETMGKHEFSVLQTSLLDLQNQDGGFSDKVVPDIRRQLYDSYYAVKTLEQLDYNLNELNRTKDWIKTISIPEQILPREECVVDLLLYIVGLYDLLDMEVAPEDERAIEVFLQKLQSEAGYFYGMTGERDTDMTAVPYQNTDILTATHTICQIFNILKTSPPYMESLKTFNDGVLQTMEQGIFDINQLEQYLVALKIDALLAGTDKTYSPAQSSSQVIPEAEWQQIIEADEMNGMFQLYFLYECHQFGNIGSEEQLECILNKIRGLSRERGGFYVAENKTTNAQADYIGVKILKEQGIELDKAVQKATVEGLLDKQYATGYFLYGESVSTVYHSYYAAKALALLPGAQKTVKQKLELYANQQMHQLLAGTVSSAEEQVFTILLAQALEQDVPTEAFDIAWETMAQAWQAEPSEQSLMTLRYFMQALEQANADISSERKKLIFTWYLDYSEHKRELSGAEKILQTGYLYDIGSFLQKEGMAFPFDEQALETCIQQEVDVLQTTDWSNIVFLNELLGFCENYHLPLTFTDKLPSMEKLYTMAEADLKVLLSAELIYNLLQYNLRILPIDTADELYEAMNQRGSENQKSFKRTQTISLNDEAFVVERDQNLFREIVLMNRENGQGGTTELEPVEEALQALLDTDARYFITEGMYQPFEEKAADSNRNHGLWIAGNWYSNGEVVALCDERIVGYHLAAPDHKILRFTQIVNFKMYGRADAEIYGLDYKIHNNGHGLIKTSETYDNYDIVALAEHVPIIIKPKAFGFLQNVTYTVTMDYGYGGHYANMAVESIWER